MEVAVSGHTINTPKPNFLTHQQVTKGQRSHPENCPVQPTSTHPVRGLCRAPTHASAAWWWEDLTSPLALLPHVDLWTQTLCS